MINRASTAAWTAALALSAALTLPSCDNPACAFSGDCNGGGGGGGLGDAPATLPSDHLWLSAGAPSIQEFFPQGNAIASTTPLAILFSESIAPASIGQAFEIALVESGGIGQAIPLTAALVGDGRVAVLLPAIALELDTEYVVRFRENAEVLDLQGSAVVQPDDREVGTFSTAASDPTAPRLVMTYPQDGFINQSATGELVVLFDRPINPTSVNQLSWIVQVNGAAPAQDPAPIALTINVGQGGVTETRVWRWRSVDAAGEAVNLPLDADVTLRLSPPGAPISAAQQGGGTLAQADIDYRLAPFAAPLALDIVSQPNDAIGVANLDGSAPLEVALDLAGTLATDELSLFVVGNSLDAQPQLIALFRAVELGTLLSYDPLLQTVSIGEQELDLASGTLPLAARLAEGEISIAAALRRGTASSPVRVLDVDRAQQGVQPVLLDVTPPTFVGFGSSGTNVTRFASEQLDLVVVGRADEQLRSVEVTSGALNNGVRPDVVAASAEGLFIAAPVALGLVDPAQGVPQFDMVLYDRAYNASIQSVLQADFQQVGAVGPGLAVPGSATTIDVRLVDARSLAPIANALVFVHEDLGLTHDIVDVEATDANGFAQLEAALIGDSLLTVDAVGYDLLSLADVNVSSVRLALARSGSLPGVGGGTVTNTTAFTSFERYVSDARRLEQGEPLLELTSCSTIGTSSICQFGPLPVRAGPLGALSLFGIEPASSAFNFNAASFLRAFALSLPLAAADPGAPAVSNLSSTQLLSDPSTVQEQRALEGPQATLDVSSVIGLLFTQLDGAPRVLVEGLAPGVSGPIAVGLGAALDGVGSPAVQWSVRSAIPGAVDPTENKYPGDVRGELLLNGTLEPGLYLRAEVRDDLGGRTGVRAPYGSVPVSLTPPSLPLVVSPLPASTTAGASYDVIFADVLPDLGDPGIYRVTLLGSDGRRWVVWRSDSTGASQSVHLPDIAADGGTALPSGAVSAIVTAYAWPGFDPDAFCFAELERRTEVVAESSPTAFLQP